MSKRSSFAYLFERFPSFTQTFCFREVEEMFAQGMNPAVWSIRQADEKSAFAPELVRHVQYFPEEAELTSQVRALRQQHKIGSAIWDQFNSWGDKGDKNRLYEAAWLGLKLKEAGIRHVHAHFAGMPARTAYWLKKFYGISYSFTGHANDIFCNNGAGQARTPLTLEDLVAGARFVATETEFSRGWLQQKFPAHAGKVFRVYNGIQTGKFSPATPPEGRPRIISVGRYIEKKGFADLIEACRILDGRGVDFECQIVGEGPLEETLKAQIQQCGIGHKVILAGPREEREVAQLLTQSSVFALPCVREADGGSDNLPTVIMEAMTCGLPVISTPIAGVPEMIEPGVTGLLVAENSPAELADALAKLLGDCETSREMGRRGRELAIAKFSTQSTTRRLKWMMIRHGRVIPTLKALQIELSRLGR